MFKGNHIRKAEPDDIDGIARTYSAIHDEIEQGRYQMKWDRNLYPTREWAEQHIAAGDMYVLEERFGGVAASAVINHSPLPNMPTEPGDSFPTTAGFLCSTRSWFILATCGRDTARLS